MRSNIHALRQQHANQKKATRALLDRAKNEKRELTSSEDAQYEAYIHGLDAIEAQILEAEAQLDEERVTAGVDVTTGAIGAGAAPRSLPKGVKPGRRYSEMFPGILSAAGFSSSEEFFKTVGSGLNDPRLMASAQGMGEDFPATGGFLVPSEFSAAMLDASLENEIVRPRAMVYPMKSATRKIAGFNNLDHAGGQLFGGFSVQWSDEGDLGINQTAKLRMIQLTAKKGMLFAVASNELIADGMSFDEMIGTALIQSIAWGFDYAFLQGNGAGQPLGVLNDPALIVVPKGATLTGNISAINIYNMFASLHPSCVKNAVWVANSTTIPQLLQLQTSVMNIARTDFVGGSAVPMVTTNVNGQFTLLTRPILFTEKLPALTSQGDLILCDFSQYAIGLRKEVTLERSIYAGWQTDESGYRAIMRLDGQGKWNQPFIPVNGNPLSWCVALQAR